ncbi:MAG: hypothetical protein WAU86_01440 [Oricola sp.]
MSARTFAIAIVLAASTGAAAAYVQNNPGSVQSLWSQATAMRGPLAATAKTETETAAPYTRSAFHKLCQRGLAQQLSKLYPTDRDAGCACMDKEIQTWSKAAQDRALVGFSQLANDYGTVSDRPRRSSKIPHRISQHEMNVIQARERQAQRATEREMASVKERFKDISVSPLTINPVTLVMTVDRLERLASQCGIMAAPASSLKEVGERYQTIGSPRQ